MSTPVESNALRIGLTLAGTLSLFGSSFIISNFVLFPKERTFSALLIFFLSLADFGVALSNLLTWTYPEWHSGEEDPPSLDGSICVLQAWGLQYFRQAAIFWTGNIALHMYLTIVQKLKEEEIRAKALGVYMILGFVFPGFLSIVPFIFECYGGAGKEGTFYAPWCWITHSHLKLRIFIFYVPMLFVWCVNVTIYYLLRKFIVQEFSWVQDRANHRLNLYLLIFVVVELPSLLNRFQNLIFPNQPIFWLFLIQVCFTQLQGFLNAVVYAWRPELWKNWICCNITISGEKTPLLQKVDLEFPSQNEKIEYEQ